MHTEILIGLNSLLVILVLILLLKKSNNAFTIKDELIILFSLLNKMYMKQTEVAQKLGELKDQTERSTAEILARFAELQEAINNAGNATPEVEAALANLGTAIQGVDDLA